MIEQTATETSQWMQADRAPFKANNAHDTNITFAGSWTKHFLEPLLINEYFMNNTLIILSFDECEVYPKQNRTSTHTFSVSCTVLTSSQAFSPFFSAAPSHDRCMEPKMRLTTTITPPSPPFP